MTKHYQNEIDKLKKDILHVTALVEENLRAAVRAIMDRNPVLAREVIDRDIEIDNIEVELEEEVLKILALYQPVAIDLRFIISVLKINNDLERIGDLAENIAERAISMARRPELSFPFDLNDMLQKVMEMVKKSADSLVGMDTEIAADVCESDDEVDECHRLAYRAIIDELKNNPSNANFLIDLLSVSRNLERIADHATNIAEDVIYMVDGEIVRHQNVEVKDDLF
jgi:phosphate transport system protein